jgi:PAS domain S-box-containing protein
MYGEYSMFRRPSFRFLSGRSAVIAPLLAFALVLIATGVAATMNFRANERLRDVADDRRVDEAVRLIERRMDTYVDVLVSGRSFVNEVGADDPVVFGEFVRGLDLAVRHPGIQMLAFAELVEPADADQFVTERRAGRAELGGPQFEIRPPPSDEQIVAMTMVEPLMGNELALGFDLASETVRRTTLEKARDTGLAIASPPLRLVQETGSQTGVLVMMPIYSSDGVPTAVEDRRSRFAGVMVAAVRIGDLLNGVLGDGAQLPGFAVRDATGDEIPQTMYSVDDAPIDVAADESNLRGSVDVADRTWVVHVGNAGDVLPTSQALRPFGVLVVGVIIAVLVAAVMRATRAARLSAERLAEARTSELDALTAAAGDGIITVDVDGHITGWNAAAERIFGYREADICGQPLTVLLAVEDVERYGDRFLRMAKGGSVPELAALAQQRSIELVAAHRSGRRFPVELSLARWTAEGTEHFTGFVRDVSERRAGEDRLRETTDLLTTVFGAVEIALIATDPDGTIVAFNPGAEQLLGYSADDVIGHATPERFHVASEVIERAIELGVPPGFEVFVAAARRGETESRRWTYVRADGGHVPVELTVTALRHVDGNVTGFLGVAVDLTDRLAFERATDTALERERQVVASLRELDAVKSEFVSTVSHELRTPLSSIAGFTELLIDDLADDEESRRSMLEAVERNAQRLLALVDDLLTVSRIEADRLDLERVPVDVASVVRSAADTVEPLVRGKNLEFVVVDDGPAVAVGDGRHLERVVLNLLSNAIKATPDGGEITLAVAGTDGTVTVTVADTGIGIPSDELGGLFTRFRRTSNSQREAIQGTGLGLTIVRSIVEAHGGTVDVASEEGAGTTFTVRLPIAELQPAGGPAPVTITTEVEL